MLPFKSKLCLLGLVMLQQILRTSVQGEGEHVFEGQGLQKERAARADQPTKNRRGNNLFIFRLQPLQCNQWHVSLLRTRGHQIQHNTKKSLSPSKLNMLSVNPLETRCRDQGRWRADPEDESWNTFVETFLDLHPFP